MKVKSGTQVPERYKVPEIETDHGESRNAEVVHRWIAQCALGLQRTRRSRVHDGKESNIKLLKEGEIEYEKLDRDGAIHGGHVHA